MAVNDATIALIKSHEGLRLKAYADPGYGWDVATIGYGHTSAAGGLKVTPGLTITDAEAETILRRDLEVVEARVRSLVKMPITDNQFGALVSLAFNIGGRAFADSTLLRLLNAGDYAGAAGQFKRWNKSNKKVLKGLTRRRADEAALFQKTPPFREPFIIPRATPGPITDADDSPSVAQQIKDLNPGAPLRRAILQRLIMAALNQLKGTTMFTGYKTYIAAGLIVLIAAAEQFVGVDIPGFDLSLGDAVSVALAAIFARLGAKTEAAKVADKL